MGSKAKPKYPPMTEKRWIKFARSLNPGDILFTESVDPTGKIISWGTGNGNYCDPNHVFVYYGKEGGASGCTVEALFDGVRFSNIDNYKDNVMKGKGRLLVFRLKNFNARDEEIMLDYMKKRQVGKRYNYLALAGFAITGLINNIPLVGGPVAWLLRKIPNPFAAKKTSALICSRQTRNAILAIPGPAVLKAYAGSKREAKYAALAEGRNEKNESPESLFERMHKVASFINDTMIEGATGFKFHHIKKPKLKKKVN